MTIQGERLVSFPIYFSGSISGGKSDVALYRRIVETLRAAGYPVIDGEVTAHSFEERDDREIFDRDIAWLEQVAAQGGAVVAEVSTPSLGVGYEIATARQRLGLPVYALYRPGRARCSGMVAGDPGVTLIRYAEGELEDALQRLLTELGRGQ